MITSVKITMTDIDNLKRRIVQFIRFGKSDVQTAVQIAPYGIDSNPIKNMVGIYAPSQEKGKTVLIGYLNVDLLTAPGEIRIYCTDQSGTLKGYHWLKVDGSHEFNGNTKNLASYQELASAFNELKADHNELVNRFNSHSHPTDGSPPSGAPVGTCNADITGAKIDHLKTN